MRRRNFLHCSVCASGAWLLGCDGEADPDAGPGLDGGPGDAGQDAGGSACDDVFAGGTMLGVVSFVDEDLPHGAIRGQGWDGRLYTDLSTVEQADQAIDNANFYVRTVDPDQIDRSGVWTIEVDGHVDAPVSLTLDDIAPYVVDQGLHVLECSGNFRQSGFGLLSAGQWAGAPLSQVLDELVSLSPAATRVLVSGFDGHSVPSNGGHSTPGASWIFTLEEVAQTGMFLATEMNGVPVPPNHGDPVRLYVPGWYGCTCIKWVDEIRLVDDDEPSTAQMREFASRTHQTDQHLLARDFAPASMHQAAMPVRVEKWRVNDEIVYRVLGILWGGSEPTEALRLVPSVDQIIDVEVCPPMTQNATWTTWQTAWRPTATGMYNMLCEINDPSIPTRRLDTGYYGRLIDIDEV